LGRAREIAFRAAGEGSSGARDLDAFDAWYEQLVLYDRAHRAITGGYRLARVDEVLADRGVTGLYTYTLFDFDARLLREIGPALELGRSFVAPDAQRSFTPLLLLWKAIAAYVAREPRYRRLFGPVSIHAGYRDLSKRLMVSFLRHHLAAPDVAAWLRPRHPYRRPRRRATHLRRWSHVAASLEELDAIVTELEQGEAGVPVLLRQYLKLGAKPLGFNVDPRFASVLDALLLVDLVETDPRILGRYMGRVPLRAFRAFHGLGPGTGQAGPEPGAVAEPATPCLGAG